MNNKFSKSSNVKKAVTTLQNILAQIGWNPEPNDESSFYIDFGPPHTPIADAIAAIVVDAQQFIFYINFGVAVPPGIRDEVARFITRANWGLSIGNFEMDYGDGHLRFKSSLDFHDADLSEVSIRNAILMGMKAVEAYAEPLMTVIDGQKDALQAIQEAEIKQTRE